MLCGRCKKPILCISCGETEYSQHVDDGHDFVPDECHCEKFKPDDCQECAKVKRYVDKDKMWYIKTWVETIQISIFMVCLIGTVISFIVLIVAFPIVWGKPISYQPIPWLNNLMGWSVCVGLVNFLLMLSCDKNWRDDYEDHSMIFNIRETKE